MAKTCKYCGNPLPDESNICLDCFSLCNEYQQPKTSPKTNYKSKAKSIIAVISSILMVIGCYTSSAMLCNNKLPTISDNEIHNNNHQDNENKLKTPIEKIYDFLQKNDNHSEESDFDTADTNNPKEEDSGASTNPDTVHTSVNSTESNFNTANTSKPKKISDSSTTSNIAHKSPSNETSDKKDGNSSTNKPANPTTKPSSTHENDDNGTDSFDYSIENGKLIIKKYTGNATHVVIPDKIDGLNVYRIESRAFFNNAKIKSITFKDSEEYHILWINGKAFENLSSLEKITFPKNTDLGILNDVCNNCPKLNQIYIDNWQYKMVDGGLYYYNTKEWTIQYLCEGLNQTTFTVPTWCRNIYQGDLLTYNHYVTTVNVNSYVPTVNFIGGSKHIKEVNVDSENPYIKSINGIVYSKSNPNTLAYYPYAKTDKEYKVPDNTYLSLAYDVNNYVETLRIPASVTISKSTIRSICLNYTFRNLKTIYIEKSSPYADQIKSTFTGKTILY